MLEQISKQTGKSKGIILLEFMRDKYPITFKRMLENEQLTKTGKMINCSERVNTYIELQNDKLVELELPEEIRKLQDKYFN